LAGCGTKEDASLAVYAQKPALTKASNAFGSSLSGSVEVVFDLGKYTQGSITVEAIQLGLYRDTTQVVPRAMVTPPAGTTFPITLAPGQKQIIAYTIKVESLTMEEANALCAGPVKVSGTVQQAGQGPQQIGADPITVTGC
jgi:hypothetical protein